MNDFQQLLAAIRSHPKAERGSGVSEEEVRAAERALATPISGQYREFLLELGWVTIDLEDVFGLGAEAPADLVREALWERNESGCPVPPSSCPSTTTGGATCTAWTAGVRGSRRWWRGGTTWGPIRSRTRKRTASSSGSPTRSWRTEVGSGSSGPGSGAGRASAVRRSGASRPGECARVATRDGAGEDRGSGGHDQPRPTSDSRPQKSEKPLPTP